MGRFNGIFRRLVRITRGGYPDHHGVMRRVYHGSLLTVVPHIAGRGDDNDPVFLSPLYCRIEFSGVDRWRAGR